jgi:FKBP-type peptidyl-prolyl cis-trans isomerase SlyD
MTVQDGKRVSLEYTLRLEDRSVVESNVGHAALHYTHGANEIIPGLEEQLSGLAVGASKSITVSAEHAYGPVDPAGFHEIDKQQVPEEAWQAGAPLVTHDHSGQERHLRVHEVRANTVVLDINHPLAGKTLVFDITVLAIE